jgi:hypothetical protein
MSPKHGYAAFAPEDREDARRRRPAVTLEDWAAERGLEFLGRAPAAGFRPALPRHLEYVHNLVRGTLPGGRFGIACHELVQTHTRSKGGMPGTYHGKYVANPGGLRRALRPDRRWLPVIGPWLTPADEDDDRPFGVTGAWAPATTCAVVLPQAIGRLPRLRGAVLERAYLVKTASDFDAGPFRMTIADRFGDPDALAAVLAEPFERFDLPFADLELREGVLRMRRNGYLSGLELDAFCADVAALAAALEHACGRVATADFAAPLPACPWTGADEETAAAEPGLAGPWTADLRSYAAAHRLVLEDAAAWHAAFGAFWAPGHAVAVMRGALPGDGRPGRVLFTTDAPIPQLRALRGAIAFATPGRPDTPPGGVRPPGARATVQVRDGVTYAFAHRTYGRAGEAAGMPEQLLAAAAAV